MDQDAVVGDVEVGAESVQRLLDPLVTRRMGQEERLVAQVSEVRNEDAGAVEKATVHVPRCLQLADLQALHKAIGVVRRRGGPTNLVEEDERGPGKSVDCPLNHSAVD